MHRACTAHDSTLHTAPRRTPHHAAHHTTPQAIGYQGPTLGAKLASANRRSFTEEQLAAGLSVSTPSK